jgi:hypothetical protein
VSEAIADHKKASAKAGDVLLPVNVENTADLGSRLRLAHSEETVKKLRAALVQHEAVHEATIQLRQSSLSCFERRGLIYGVNACPL